LIAARAEKGVAFSFSFVSAEVETETRILYLAAAPSAVQCSERECYSDDDGDDEEAEWRCT
jgi:hypothetical protein